LGISRDFWAFWGFSGAFWGLFQTFPTFFSLGIPTADPRRGIYGHFRLGNLRMEKCHPKTEIQLFLKMKSWADKQQEGFSGGSTEGSTRELNFSFLKSWISAFFCMQKVGPTLNRRNFGVGPRRGSTKSWNSAGGGIITFLLQKNKKVECGWNSKIKT
jgi:hypothetical protein